MVRVGVHYKLSRLLVERVEAVDGQYDVLFIGTGVCVCGKRFCLCVCVCVFEYITSRSVLCVADSGQVLKSIHLPKEHGVPQEVTLEQLQVFQVQRCNLM